MNAWSIDAERMGKGSIGFPEAGGEPELHGLGDQHILERKLVGFFCSVRCPGNLILKAYDLAQGWRAENQPVIGGFHSPVESEVLKIMLRSTVPVCVVLARSLPKRIPAEFRRPLEEGRLLLLSPFDAKTKRATKETAARRNHVVAALADKVFVAYAAPGSKTVAFCELIAKTGKTCMTFDDPKTDNLKLAGSRFLFEETCSQVPHFPSGTCEHVSTASCLQASPGSAAGCPAAPPQSRTSATNASGSSGHGFARVVELTGAVRLDAPRGQASDSLARKMPRIVREQVQGGKTSSLADSLSLRCLDKS